MSHFSVLVIGKDHKKLLELYDENTTMPRYVDYTKKEHIEKERKSIKDFEENSYKKYLADKEEYKKNCRTDTHITYLENEFPKKLHWSDEELYKEAVKYHEKHEIGEDGETYSTYNPKSKWDWYELGGRWNGLLLLKEGATGNKGKKGLMGACANEGREWTDQAEFKDIDWEGMQKLEAEKDYSKQWDEVIAGKDLYKPEYYLERYKTKEEYIKRMCEFGTYAVVTEDGQWHESGKMGWWGCSSETAEDKEKWDEGYHKCFLTDRKPDDLISIIDCHI